jgi:hypothetical protein
MSGLDDEQRGRLAILRQHAVDLGLMHERDARYHHDDEKAMMHEGREDKMSDEVCWLITVLHGDTILLCALKVKRCDLPGDCAQYPMEPENRKVIHALLPLHVRACGPIISMEQLFDVHVANATP